ncbi:hypothetical protein SUGI_0116220 [Cryptomeria japonica]|nr:hypothetical protein SUGI_0116220 [Cryptomeria japonica]
MPFSAFQSAPLYLLRFLFLFFPIFKLCLALSQACPEPCECGGHLFEYHFGRKNSGCGDPTFPLDCDDKVKIPLINISGYQYYILEPFDHLRGFPINSMQIVDTNMWGEACNPSSSNLTMEFWSSPQFRISGECMNISIWGECREEIIAYLPTETYALECNKSWYHSDFSLGTYCKSLVQLPVKMFDRDSFRVKWNFSEGCEHCKPWKKDCISDNRNLRNRVVIP